MLALHAYLHMPPSPPYPLPKARCPDEPRKRRVGECRRYGWWGVVRKKKVATFIGWLARKEGLGQSTLEVNNNEDERVPSCTPAHALRLRTTHERMSGRSDAKLLNPQTNATALRIEMVSGEGRCGMDDASHRARARGSRNFSENNIKRSRRRVRNYQGRERM